MLQAGPRMNEEANGNDAVGAPTEPGADRAERLLAELNERQREAVRHGEGPLLVLAGAGSGKTRVLAHRIAYLLATDAARPGEILAITFTNKAAKEMRERVEALVGRSARAMWVTTFHSACARMLRADAERLGYSRGFTIYDESDSLRMLKRCLEELHVDPKRYPPRAIRSQISGAKNQLVDAPAYSAAQGSVFEEVVAEAYALYEKRMLEANAMDFDDLLVRTVNALELFEEVRERWRRTFRHVLVDEYQDTNHAQYRLLQLLTERGASVASISDSSRASDAGGDVETEHGNLMVVGDEDQSIYGFRHADIRNILDFERDFPEAKVVKLEQNYRSTQTILSAANAVVEHNRERRPKKLWTELADGEPLQLNELSDEHEEARWVAGEIERLGDEEGVGREDVAVFYRTNAMSRVLEDTLVRFELPYQVIGGTKFYERAEIKDAVAYLSLLVNPADQVCFARVVNSPRRGIGNTSQARLAAHANTTGLPIWEVAGRAEEVPGLGAAAIKAISGFYETMEDLRARAERAPVAELLEATLRESGYLDALAAERTVEAEGRVENLEELIGVAREFDLNHELEGEGELSPLEEFLQQISLYTEQDGLREESLITLMTLHNAKGLEYDTVFVVGCEDGAFPHMRALEEGGEEEERRLCYVGITRARRRLYMSWTRERRLFGRAEHNLPSRFVDELPDELVERHSSAPGGGVGWGAAPVGDAPGPIEPGPALELGTGDEVVHAGFGDGVVTAVEPGGIVVVRFAGDGSERKLMADYAPIRRR
jgi:DNA helicase II / ATP-dependent DNA helicase PcrA